MSVSKNRSDIEKPLGGEELERLVDPADRHLVLRLTARQWCAALVAVTMLALALPRLGRFAEQVPSAPEARLPYALSTDYWLYARRVEAVIAAADRFVLGDSVIWGEYVTEDETLSAALSRQGSRRYANLGVNGTHPLALEGLVRYHATALRGVRVIVHCNPLWLGSPRHDLRERDGAPFNHPRLVPQFWPRVPSLETSFSERLGVLIDRHCELGEWARHLRLTRLGGEDFGRWSLRHPRSTPLVLAAGGGASRADAPRADSPRHDTRAWTERRMELQDLPWVACATSLQWRAFQRTLEVLLERGNDVLVVVGPFNAHALTPASRARLGVLLEDAALRLERLGVPVVRPPLLPSAEYADLSHPLAPGYARLAATLRADRVFAGWDEAR